MMMIIHDGVPFPHYHHIINSNSNSGSSIGDNNNNNNNNSYNTTVNMHTHMHMHMDCPCLIHPQYLSSFYHFPHTMQHLVQCMDIWTYCRRLLQQQQQQQQQLEQLEKNGDDMNIMTMTPYLIYTTAKGKDDDDDRDQRSPANWKNLQYKPTRAFNYGVYRLLVERLGVKIQHYHTYYHNYYSISQSYSKNNTYKQHE
jgi:hypothetical protein